MAELIGEEQIDWENFRVGDPEAPEYEAPAEPESEAAADTPADEADTADGERPPETSAETTPDDEVDEPPSYPDDDRLYAGKYKSAEDLEKAYLEAQSLIGRRDSERDDLREQVQSLVQAMQQQATQPPRFTPSHDVDSLIASQGLLAAAEATAQAQDWQAHNRVIAEWAAQDPDAAGMYQLAKQAQYEASVSQQRAEQLAAEQTKAQGQTALANAWRRVQAEFPELADGAAGAEQFRDAMSAEADEASRLAGQPVYSTMIESGDPNQAYFALRTLAQQARGRHAAQVGQQAVDHARTAAAASAAAKAEALVTSANATGPEPPAPKSYDEEFLEQLEAEDAPRNDGWRIGAH